MISLMSQGGQRPSGMGYAQSLVNLGQTLAGGNGGFGSKLLDRALESRLGKASQPDFMFNASNPFNAYNIGQMLPQDSALPPMMPGAGSGYDPINALRMSQIPIGFQGMAIPDLSLSTPAARPLAMGTNPTGAVNLNSFLGSMMGGPAMSFGGR